MPEGVLRACVGVLRLRGVVFWILLCGESQSKLFGVGREGLTEFITGAIGAGVFAFLARFETSPEPLWVFFFGQSNWVFSALYEVQSL